jgi:alpha-1,3/alpha-1,6-mannosyltransferase
MIDPGESVKMAAGKKRTKTIVFLHPDLGIGGAERLVVDAAVGLQKRGHRVVIFTSHCDPAHCFDEARDGISYTLPSFFCRRLDH